MEQMKKKSSDMGSVLEVALEEYQRTQNGTLPYKCVPREICEADTRRLDLSKWTLVLTDRCLELVSQTQLGRVQQGMGGVLASRTNDCKSLLLYFEPDEMLGDELAIFSEQMEIHGLTSLDIRGCEKITDRGLHYVRSCAALRIINLENAYQITSVGLRNLVTSCTKIKDLNLSGCLGVDGVGFGSIGQHLSELMKLRLSGCRQIQSSALIQIFQGCHNLQLLDLSYCNMVTNHDLKVMSDNCADIRHLNIKECHHVSDATAHALSYQCPSLEYITFSRSEMSFQITDVSLLAFGERSRNLRTLCLRGCDMITDTGISWLSKGCQNLQYLDLTNCSKVTNGGMRFIGDTCSDLRSINLKHLKRITDVGIRFVTQGCPRLESLNATGLYLISDGLMRDFGFEGLQALARSDCAKTMSALNLSGCFRVSTNALHSISSLENLRSLSLSGCINLALRGVTAVAENCKRLEYLSLAHCGACVTDGMIEQFCGSMRYLDNVVLAECEKIGRGSLEALSNCCGLRRLDLTCCTNIDDDALMVLSEATFVPGLIALYLAGCSKVTNAGLTWISDGQRTAPGRASLVTLSLKGTQITKTGLVAVRDYFKYSQIKKNNSFFGLWPLSRSSEREFMTEHKKRRNAIEKIQSMCRLRNDRKRVTSMIEKRELHRGVKQLQAVWRGSKARRDFTKLIRAREKRTLMAIRIQCIRRLCVASKVLSKLRVERWRKRAPVAALHIQRCYRGAQGRSHYKVMRERRLIQVAQEEISSVRIQNRFRVFLARSKFHKLFVEKQNWERIQLESTLIISRTFRSFIAKRTYRDLKALHDEFSRMRHYAAITIARAYRNFCFRTFFSRRLGYKKQRQYSATRIQCFFRSIAASRDAKNIREDRTRRKVSESAVVIQTALRRRAALLLSKRLLSKRKLLDCLKAEKAVLIRRWWRGALGRKRARFVKARLVEEIKEQIRMELWAATTISAAWRGKRDRSRVKSIRSDKLCGDAWKELYSEEKSRHFYYNQVRVFAAARFLFDNLLSCL